jgi:hypothetical protein
VLLPLALNYRWCCCHWQYIIAGIVGTGNKFIAGMGQAINENPCLSVFTDVMDTCDKFIAGMVDTTLYQKPDLYIPGNETA